MLVGYMPVWNGSVQRTGGVSVKLQKTHPTLLLMCSSINNTEMCGVLKVSMQKVSNTFLCNQIGEKHLRMTNRRQNNFALKFFNYIF